MISRSTSLMSRANVGRGALSLNTKVVIGSECTSDVVTPYLPIRTRGRSTEQRARTARPPRVCSHIWAHLDRRRVSARGAFGSGPGEGVPGEGEEGQRQAERDEVDPSCS